jgi:hypothetical protein
VASSWEYVQDNFGFHKLKKFSTIAERHRFSKISTFCETDTRKLFLSARKPWCQVTVFWENFSEETDMPFVYAHNGHNSCSRNGVECRPERIRSRMNLSYTIGRRTEWE